MFASPRLRLEAVQHSSPHFLQQWRVLHRRWRRQTVGQLVVQFGMEHQPGCVEKFVSKGVPVEHLVLNERRVQTDGDLARVKAQAASANQFSTAFLKTRHAQAVVVYVQPFHREPVSDPRQKDGFNVPG